MTQNVPRGTMTIGNALRTALGIFSGKMIFICETGRSADLPVSLFSRKGRKGEQVVFSFTSSPSQSPSVTALPKGEPLAKLQALRFDRKLYRHAKASPFGGGGSAQAVTERARPFAGKLPS